MSDSSLDLDASMPLPAEPASVTAGPSAGTSPAEVPAAATDTLTLTPPAPVEAVAPTQAVGAVKLDAEQTARIDQLVGSYVDAITKLDVHDQAFTARVNDIANMGSEDIRGSAAVSNRLLSRPRAALQKGGISESSNVSKSLLALRRTVEDLDPSRQRDLLSPHKLLGILPFGSHVVDYFRKYQSSQGHINAIITSLNQGRDELRQDNVDIGQEMANLWTIMGRLRQYAYLGQQLDTGLTTRIAAIEATDPERATTLKNDLLFPVRQKVQDLLTQLAVSVQGYLALDLIRRNNVELTKGVDRATTTTVSALRTAVIVAQALSDQKLVLDQITALNTTTGDLIESTSGMLRQQSGVISEQAASATVDIARLEAAFQNIYATMDEIDAFKIKALDNLSRTIDTLSSEVAKSQAYTNRVRAQESAGQQTSELDGPSQ